MCGIVGVLSFNKNAFQINEPYINTMRDTMVHRGPDAEGTWISKDKSIGLAHRRLSIIDLSENATQPMCNHDQSIWLTYNGEIYNHQEIKNELNAIGDYKWRTDHSDTEVIIHAFKQWGIECIHKFRGIFAFGLWDDDKKELWLVRDRIGVKPLYYSFHNNRITFASEIKALLKDPDQKREVDEKAFYDYLSFLTAPAPNTLFKGIHKLPAGTWLKINGRGDYVERKYWDVLDHTRDLTRYSEDEISKLILKELSSSIDYRKTSDVPVGVFLSGGIDSSTNAALFSKDQSHPIKTFTIGYKGEYDTYKNETHYAKKMAATIHSDHHEILLTIDDLIDFVPQMIKLQDEPIADPVCVPVYYVSKLAKDNQVTVCQVGEGADELYWGYPNWKLLLNAQKQIDTNIFNPLISPGMSLLKMLGKETSFYYAFLQRAQNHQPIFWGGAEAFTEVGKNKILSDRLQKQFKDYSSWEAIKPIYDNYKKKGGHSRLNWMSYLDLNLRLPELLLMRVDKMSMGTSLECRVPFLDHKFVELSMSIPESLKTKNGVLKSILKKAVTGVIPDEFIHRKKQGFGVPVHEWFFSKLGHNIKKDLDAFCDQTDFFNKGEINKIIKEGNGTSMWYLYNFTLWWKEYIR